MRTFTRLVFVFILIVPIELFSQFDSRKTNELESLIKIPGSKNGDRYILTLKDFSEFKKLDTKFNDIEIKSFSILALGKDSGLIIKKFATNEIDENFKSIIRDFPFLGYRIIVYDIDYVYKTNDNGTPYLELMNPKYDLTKAFIIELKN